MATWSRDVAIMSCTAHRWTCSRTSAWPAGSYSSMQAGRVCAYWRPYPGPSSTFQYTSSPYCPPLQPERSTASSAAVAFAPSTVASTRNYMVSIQSADCDMCYACVSQLATGQAGDDLGQEAAAMALQVMQASVVVRHSNSSLVQPDSKLAA